MMIGLSVCTRLGSAVGFVCEVRFGRGGSWVNTRGEEAAWDDEGKGRSGLEDSSRSLVQLPWSSP